MMRKTWRRKITQLEDASRALATPPSAPPATETEDDDA